MEPKHDFLERDRVCRLIKQGYQSTILIPGQPDTKAAMAHKDLAKNVLKEFRLHLL